MDEVLDFCQRVLLDPALAAQAADSVRAGGPAEGPAQLAAAVRACRVASNGRGAPYQPGAASPEATVRDAGDGLAPRTLVAAVADELSAASRQLAERHREVLALRERAGLDYAEIAESIGVESAAVGPLLARARLRLRAALRGHSPLAEDACAARDRALAALARRQDAEPVSEEEEDWLFDHLSGCEGCDQAFAAMLEASVRYRAWSTEAQPAPA